MKLAAILFCIFFFGLLLVQAGCEPPQAGTKPTQKAIYTPAKVYILPLTEFVNVGDAEKQTQVKLYVSLLDSFGSQIKAPGVFRFELYEYVQRSAEPMGRRVSIWPDIDLTNPVENNKFWRDFLRAYEFNLPFDPAGDKNYILQTTCLRPDGRRLSAEFNLKYTK